MGEKLVREALNYANNPDALSTAERMWLVKQAADADDETRVCAKSRSDYGWDEMLADLLAKRALQFQGEQVVFTQMDMGDAFHAYGPTDAYAAYRANMSAQEGDEGPSAFWYH